MKIKVNVSPTMDKETGWNDEYEHRIVRVPEVCRIKHNLLLGDFIHLRTVDGELITFQIAEAFKEDVSTNPEFAYLTTVNYQKLFLLPGEGSVSELKMVQDITLGCDPEVFLVDRQTGNIAGAHRFVPKYGAVGNDGLLMEFRPQPSVDATEVCNTLWGLICKARGVLNKFTEGNTLAIIAASSHSSGLTAGFHLHYGMPRGLLGFKKDKKVVARVMTAAFDYYVGVPSIIPEGNRDTHRRTFEHLRYGKPGQFVLDNRTFEFRMPGGINMVHPILTRGLLSLGAVVAEDTASRINTCTDCFTNLSQMMTSRDFKILYPNIPDAHSFFSIICNPDIGAAKAHFEVIKEDVRKMVGYEKRAEAVEAYFQVLDHDIVFGNNIEKNWGEIYNAKQQEKMVVL